MHVDYNRILRPSPSPYSCARGGLRSSAVRVTPQQVRPGGGWSRDKHTKPRLVGDALQTALRRSANGDFAHWPLSPTRSLNSLSDAPGQDHLDRLGNTWYYRGMPSPLDITHRPRRKASVAGKAFLAWVAPAALLFAACLAPLLHESLHERLAGHASSHPCSHGPTAGARLATAEPGHEHPACPICSTLAGLHLAWTDPPLSPIPEIIVSRCPELTSPPRLGLLQPLGFRHRGPPALA